MKDIIFWLPQGRLGNQVFQYQAINEIFQDNATIMTINMGFSETFSYSGKFIFLKFPIGIRNRLLEFFIKVGRFLVNYKLIGIIKMETIYEKGFPIEGTTKIIEPGFFKHIWFVDGWFQFSKFLKNIPSVKKQLIDTAELLISDIPRGSRVGIHLRFGDFKAWSILGVRDVTLPYSYYNEAINWIKANINEPKFIIFSDDQIKAREIFGDGADVNYFSSGSTSVDYAGMCCCDHGIMSASTFSLCAFSSISNSRRMLVAPKYWAGFKSDIWYPSDFSNLDVQFIQVI